MELTEAIRTAGSTRLFRTDPVPDEVLYRVLDSARFAASSGNRQPWRVIVVRDAGLRTQLRDFYLNGWRLQVVAASNRPLNAPPTPSDHYAEHLHEVPVQLVVLVDRRGLVTGIDALDRSSFVGGASIYPFVQNIVLAVRAEGLGTTVSTVTVPVREQIMQLLEIPLDFGIAAHLGVGWPAGPLPTRLSRRPVEEFVTIDRFNGHPLSR
jgi:nitroreductase